MVDEFKGTPSVAAKQAEVDVILAARLQARERQLGRQLSGRQLLVEEFKGTPSVAAKQAEAAAILAARPDALLRNLKVKAQVDSSWFPEGCDVDKGGNARR